MADGKLGLWAVVSAALFRPGKLFEAVKAGEVRVRPVLVYVAGLVASGAALGITMAASTGQEWLGLALLWGAFALALSPLAWYFDLGTTHAAVRLLGGQGKLRETKAALGFSSIPRLFAFVPIISMVFELWGLVLRVWGLCALHGFKWWRGALAVIAPVLAAVLLAFAVRGVVIEAFKVPAGSMFPSVEIGDHLFVTKATYDIFSKSAPARGSVVVFQYPEPNLSGGPPTTSSA